MAYNKGQFEFGQDPYKSLKKDGLRSQKGGFWKFNLQSYPQNLGLIIIKLTLIKFWVIILYLIEQ